MSKRKHNKQHRKPRVTEVRVAFDRDVVIGGISAPGVEPMQFFGADGKPLLPTKIEIGQGYSRAKSGLKMIHRAAADPTAMYRDSTRSLTRFKTILAVDTNTRRIRETNISVTSSVAVCALRFDEEEPRRWYASLVDQDCYEFHDATIAPELLGWREILRRAVRTPIPAPAALVVDSELGRLSRFNAREEHIVQDFPLPVGFELVYASSERGTTESVSNAALAHCDRISTSILDRIELDPMVEQMPLTNDQRDPLIKGYRMWSRAPQTGTEF